MSASRTATFAAAAFFTSGLSLDPAAAIPDHVARPRPVITLDHAITEAPGAVEATETPVPADVTIEVTADARSGHRVMVQRKGYLVSLRHEDARAAGEDWAAMHLAKRPTTKHGAEARDRLVWETTHPSTLQTTRGLAILSVVGDTMRATLSSARAPEPAGAWKSKHATCAAHRDGLGGFTTLCRFDKTTKHLGVANVTGARTLDDVWITSGPSPIVRLDLPRREGSAEGRIIGFSFGQTGVVLRTEASFPEGEPATLLLEESERSQPQAPSF
ncbi:Hypothetical protein A7982_07328 [Minicystis rosea]|nr:Hypothetical protein A7982_07328 [Minicystis rosea]